MILCTPLTAFYNDLCDVIRLFCPKALSRGEQDGLRIEHGAQGWQDTFALFEQGERIASFSHQAQPQGDTPLETTRFRKRACKNALYALLKEHTGAVLPWGSLTGIRPTRLYAEALARLGDQEQAIAQLQREFDVSREKGELLRDIAAVQGTVAPAGRGQFDVYVGIPFCPTRCSYCSFAADELARSGHLIDRYLQALAGEIRAGARDAEALGMRARAVYVGGGTPTTLSAAQLDELLSLLRARFLDAIEWTVEAGRPDTIDEAKLDVLAARGVGRLSINPQSMNDRTLRAIGRGHTAADIERAAELAAGYSFSTINMDVIAGLPGESAGDVRDTVARAVAMGAGNVTVHTLAIKRASRMREQGGLPPQSEAEQMVRAAADLLRGAGFAPYYLYRQKYMAGNLENVGYALPGQACIYNIDNMEETAPILAFGAGAITKWLYPRERRIERAPNVRNIEHYIARADEMADRKRVLMHSENPES